MPGNLPHGFVLDVEGRADERASAGMVDARAGPDGVALGVHRGRLMDPLAKGRQGRFAANAQRLDGSASNRRA